MLFDIKYGCTAFGYEWRRIHGLHIKWIYNHRLKKLRRTDDKQDYKIMNQYKKVNVGLQE